MELEARRRTPPKWEPTPDEVREIVRQLRPLLCKMAEADRKKIAAEILRRRRARVVA